jgi:hypothetical protein
VIALRLTLLVLAGMFGAAPCLAQPALQLVWWPLVTDGQEYRRVPYPQEAGAILVLADTDVVLDARLAPVAYWPITREYLADLSQQPRTVTGSIEIVDAAGEVRAVEPEPYVVWYPMGVGAGPAQLVHGENVEAFYQDYLAQARAAAAAEREYQRIVGLHQAAVEAWLRMAAERRGQDMPAPPPELEIEPPERFHAFASEPRHAAVLSLPAGSYGVRVRDAEGEIVPGSERELVSFGPLERAIGYVLRPEDRWTQPAISFAPDESIYTTGGTDVFVEPVPVLAYDADRYARLFRPQSVAAAAAAQTLWTADTRGEAADDGAALALWDGGDLVETLPRTPWRVAQLAGASRGYVIEPFEAEGAALEADFHAMRVPRDADVTRIDLVARDGAGVPVRASRRFRKVAPWPEPLLFLPALLPLAAGLAVRFVARRRFRPMR